MMIRLKFLLFLNKIFSSYILTYLLIKTIIIECVLKSNIYNNKFIHITLFFFFIFFLLVDDGAILDIILERFSYPPSNGYDKLMLEQSIL